MKTVGHARYILALASDAMTDEIRQAYLDGLEIDELGLPLFGGLVTTVVKVLSNGEYDIEKAGSVIQAEYYACKMQDVLGDYNQYKPLIDAVFEEVNSKSDKLTRCKRLVKAADETNSAHIKCGVYLAVINYMVSSRMILDDLSFSEAITSEVENSNEIDSGTDEFRMLAELALIAPSA